MTNLIVIFSKLNRKLRKVLCGCSVLFISPFAPLRLIKRFWNSTIMSSTSPKAVSPFYIDTYLSNNWMWFEYGACCICDILLLPLGTDNFEIVEQQMIRTVLSDYILLCVVIVVECFLSPVRLSVFGWTIYLKAPSPLLWGQSWMWRQKKDQFGNAVRLGNGHNQKLNLHNTLQTVKRYGKLRQIWDMEILEPKCTPLKWSAACEGTDRGSQSRPTALSTGGQRIPL